MNPDPASFGVWMLHAAIALGVLANLIVVIRFIRTGNGKDKR